VLCVSRVVGGEVSKDRGYDDRMPIRAPYLMSKPRRQGRRGGDTPTAQAASKLVGPGFDHSSAGS
jgi:hypothetical protein